MALFERFTCCKQFGSARHNMSRKIRTCATAKRHIHCRWGCLGCPSWIPRLSPSWPNGHTWGGTREPEEGKSWEDWLLTNDSLGSHLNPRRTTGAHRPQNHFENQTKNGENLETNFVEVGQNNVRPIWDLRGQTGYRFCDLDTCFPMMEHGNNKLEVTTPWSTCTLWT